MPEIKPVGKLTPVNIQKTSEIKPVGKLTPVNLPTTQNAGFSNPREQAKFEPTFWSKLNNEEWVLLHDKASSGEWTPQETKYAEDVMRGNIMATGKFGLTSSNYYLDSKNKGLPKLVAPGEKIPVGEKVASAFSKPTGFGELDKLADIGAAVYNGVLELIKTPLNIAGGVESIAKTAPGAIQATSAFMGKPSLKTLQTKPPTPTEGIITQIANDFNKTIDRLTLTRGESFQKPFLTENFKNISDVFQRASYDFTPDNAIGAVGNAISFIGQMILTEGLASTTTKGAVIVEGAISASTNVANAIVANKIKNVGALSFVMYNGSLEKAKEHGLSDAEAASMAWITSVSSAVIFNGFGALPAKAIDLFRKSGIPQDIAGSMIGSIKKEIGNKAVTEASGETIAKAFETSLKEAKPIVNNFFSRLPKELVHNVGAMEASGLFTTMAEETFDTINGYKGGEEKGYGSKLLSKEIFKEGINNAIMGAGFGVFGAIAKGGGKTELKDATIYDHVKKGESTILKNQLSSMYKNGDISAEDLQNTVIKIDAYKEYKTAIDGKDLPDESNKKVFELTWKAQDTRTKIKEMEVDESIKENEIKQAELKNLKEQHKGYVNEIADIFKGKEEPKKEETKAEQKPVVEDVQKGTKSPGTPEESNWIVANKDRIAKEIGSNDISDVIVEGKRQWAEKNKDISGEQEKMQVENVAPKPAVEEKSLPSEPEVKKEKLPPTISENQQKINSIHDDINNYNGLKKGRLGKEKPEGLQLKNKIDLAAKDLGLKFERGTLRNEKGRKVRPNYQAFGNRALNKDYVPLEKKTPEVQDIFNKLNEAGANTFPVIKDVNGKRMNQQQLKNAIDDVVNDRGTNQAHELLTQLESQVNEGGLIIRSGETDNFIPLDKIKESLLKDVEEQYSSIDKEEMNKTEKNYEDYFNSLTNEQKQQEYENAIGENDTGTEGKTNVEDQTITGVSKIGTSDEGQVTPEGGKVIELTDKEKAFKELEDARSKFKKAGGLSSGGLEAMPEFVNVVRAAIKAGYYTVKEFIEKYRDDFKGHTDKEIEAAFNIIKAEEDLYEKENLERIELDKNILGDVKENVSKLIKDANEAASRHLAPITTVLENIHPIFKQFIRDFQKFYGDAVSSDNNKIEPFLEKIQSIKKIDKKDYSKLKGIRLNNDIERYNNFIEKYGLEKEEAERKNVLEAIFQRAKENGLDLGHIKDYHPRLVKDPEAFLKYLKKNGDKSDIEIFDEEVRKYQSKQKEELTDAEKASIFNELIAGSNKGIGVPLGKTAQMKGRIIRHITPEMEKFYYSPDEALIKYIDAVNERIEARKAFGKEPSQGQSPMTVDGIIGMRLMEMIGKGEVSIEQMKEAQPIIQSYFSKKVANGFFTTVKNVGFIDAMGSITSGVTAISEIGWGLYISGGVKTFSALGKAVLNKSNIKAKEIIHDGLIGEYGNKKLTTHQAIKVLFKANLVAKMDRIGKESVINGYFSKIQEQAKGLSKMKPYDKKQFMDFIDKAFYSEIERVQVIKDLKEGKKSELVYRMIYNKVLDFMPVGRSEMPQALLDSPNLSGVYSLKHYMLKQFDVYRREVWYKLKSKEEGDRLEGAKRATRMILALASVGATTNTIKDIINGKDNSLPEELLNGLMSMFNLNNYNIGIFNKKGVVGVVESVLTPNLSSVKLVTDVAQGKVVPHIPVIGKVIDKRIRNKK